MKYLNHKLIGMAMLGLTISACTDEYDCSNEVEKPVELATQEYLNTFDVLKSYINRNSYQSFKLSTSINPADFLEHSLVYSAAVSNFDGVDLNEAYLPAQMIDESGDYDFKQVNSVAFLAKEAGMTVYGGTLCSNYNQPVSYLNKLIEPIYIPAEPEKGNFLFNDFESDEIGKTYESVQKFGDDRLTIEVVNDPAGGDGKVLQIGPKKDVMEYHLPMFDIKLPEGKTLGDMKELCFDAYWDNTGSDGDLRVYILPPGWTNRDQYKYQISGLQGLLVGVKDKWVRKVTVPIQDESSIVIDGSLKGLTEFQIAIGLCTHTPFLYLDNLGFNWETTAGGTTKIDFESDELGASYPMTNGNQAIVENDPDGVSGKVLHVGTSSALCNRTYPKFNIKLQDGLTLGDYSAISLDMYLIDGKGGWGEGMSVIINGQEFNTGKGPYTYGCDDNTWGRGLIYIPLVKENVTPKEGDIQIPNSMKDLTEFELAIGSRSGEWHAYIDNVSLHWKAEDKVIEKEPEEKKEILTKELNKWITGFIDAGEGNILVWDVISEPLNDKSDSNTFNWAEYLNLGTDNYVKTAVKFAREAYEGDLKLFVSNSFNQYDDILTSIDKLISLVNEWQSDGNTVIDGYNIKLQAIYSENADELNKSKEQITNMLTKLNSTGKGVRISDLSMIYEDISGNFVSTSEIASVQRERAAEYMTFIIKEYLRLISPENQYGISISSMNESDKGSGICPWTSGFGRTEMYEGIVNGFVNNEVQ